jgi:hypothetical protein
LGPAVMPCDVGCTATAAGTASAVNTSVCRIVAPGRNPRQANTERGSPHIVISGRHCAGNVRMPLTSADIIERVGADFSGLLPKPSWGETSLFYNPGGLLPNGVYFCTVKHRDGANDRAANLNRPGVFRFSFGLPSEHYERLLGRRPPRPPKGCSVATGHDFTVTDTVMPHPVYAWMGWVQVLSPSERTWVDLQPWLHIAYRSAVGRYAARTKPSSCGQR